MTCVQLGMANFCMLGAGIWPNKAICEKHRSGEVSRPVSVCFWGSIAAIASFAFIVAWPEPYAFRVSRLTLQAWEEQDGNRLFDLDVLEAALWYDDRLSGLGSVPRLAARPRA